jgi:hypothetical protein
MPDISLVWWLSCLTSFSYLSAFFSLSPVFFSHLKVYKHRCSLSSVLMSYLSVFPWSFVLVFHKETYLQERKTNAEAKIHWWTQVLPVSIADMPTLVSVSPWHFPTLKLQNASIECRQRERCCPQMNQTLLLSWERCTADNVHAVVKSTTGYFQYI